MERRHPHCEEDRCDICMDDHMKLRDELENRTGANRSHTDVLGEYDRWMKQRGIPDEENGWASMEAFLEKYVGMFCEWYKTGDEPPELSRKASVSRITKLLGEEESEELLDIIESFLRRAPDPSDFTAIQAAIAGEGRLVLTKINCRTCKYDLSIPPPRCYNCSHFDKWEPRRDQGGE